MPKKTKTKAKKTQRSKIEMIKKIVLSIPRKEVLEMAIVGMQLERMRLAGRMEELTQELLSIAGRKRPGRPPKGGRG